jgi:glycosyltransferase involved in cell wall biosynthesis
LIYLKAGDLFILNTGYEGFSHQILEAMTFQIPVIITAIGGNLELIKNGESGILVEYNDKRNLKNAILALYKDRDLKNKIIANARARAAEFNKEKMINETIKIFLCLTNK